MSYRSRSYPLLANIRQDLPSSKLEKASLCCRRPKFLAALPVERLHGPQIHGKREIDRAAGGRYWRSNPQSPVLNRKLYSSILTVSQADNESFAPRMMTWSFINHIKPQARRVFPQHSSSLRYRTRIYPNHRTRVMILKNLFRSRSGSSKILVAIAVLSFQVTPQA